MPSTREFPNLAPQHKKTKSLREKTPENKSNAKKQEKKSNLEKLHRNQWWRKGNAAPVPCEKHHHQCSQRLIQKTHTNQKHRCSNRDYFLFSSSKFTQKSSENRREGGESDDGLSHETNSCAQTLRTPPSPNSNPSRREREREKHGKSSAMVRARTAMRSRFFFYSTTSSFTFRELRMVITSLYITEDSVQKYATCQYDWISPVHPSRVRSYAPTPPVPPVISPVAVKAPSPPVIRIDGSR